MDQRKNNLGELISVVLGMYEEAAEEAAELASEDLDKRELERIIARSAHGVARNDYLKRWIDGAGDVGSSSQLATLASAVNQLDELEKKNMLMARGALPDAPVAVSVSMLKKVSDLEFYGFSMAMYADEMEQEVLDFEKRISEPLSDFTLLELDEITWEQEDTRDQCRADLAQIEKLKDEMEPWRYKRCINVISDMQGYVEEMLKLVERGRSKAMDVPLRLLDAVLN